MLLWEPFLDLEAVKNCIKNLSSNYAEFLTNVPKISEAARAAMEADLTLEELSSTIKSKAMKNML